MASLAATRASRSHAPANALAETIRATYGPRLLASLARWNRASVFLKTCQPTLPWDSRMFEESSKEWVTALRRDCSERQRLAQATGGSGYSSWPTTQAHDRQGRSRHQYAMEGKGGMDIASAAEHWQTPKSPDVTRNWTTPRAADFKTGSEYSENMTGKTLKMDVSLWQTPKSPDGGNTSRGNGRINEPLLAGQAKLWATPRSSASENRTTKHAPTHGTTHGETLAGQSAAWPTPKGRDWKGQIQQGEAAPGDALANAVSLYSLPDPERPMPGRKSSGSTRRLNPRFVELLMGWPVGWTHPDFDSREMESYRRRLRSHFSALLQHYLEASE